MCVSCRLLVAILVKWGAVRSGRCRGCLGRGGGAHGMWHLTLPISDPSTYSFCRVRAGGVWRLSEIEIGSCSWKGLVFMSTASCVKRGCRRFLETPPVRRYFLSFRTSIRNIRAITGSVRTEYAFGMTVVSVWREGYVSRGLTFTLHEVQKFWAWG